MTQEAQVVKVLAYVTRPCARGLEVLVFQQEGQAGAAYEVPGGGVDPGEELVDAVRREVAEEAGLTGLPEPVKLGVLPLLLEGRLQVRHVFRVRAPEGLPDRWSHTVTAGEDDCGLLFHYRWMAPAEARACLVNGQGGCLFRLME